MRTRRHWMQAMLAGGVSFQLHGTPIAAALGHRLNNTLDSQQHLIVLWMAGGPSQLDTFDLKVGHPNGGTFRETATKVPGVKFSEHFSQLAKFADHMAIVRSLKTKEGDHGRGTYLVRTGQRPGSPVKYPCFPAAVAQVLSPRDPLVPDYVSVLPSTAINPAAFTSGFLGPRHQPLTVTAQSRTAPGTEAGRIDPGPPKLKVENLVPASEVSPTRLLRRRELWDTLQQSYQVQERGPAPQTHDTMLPQGHEVIG